MQRLAQTNKQFAKDTSYNGGAIGPKRDDDVVIIGMARTAMTRAKKGPQKDTGLESMLRPCLEAVARQANIDKALVEDIVIGNVLMPGSAATNARMAMFMAGYPETTCVKSINRLCSSGLQSVATVANAIRAGQISVGIGGGFESMSNAQMADQVNPNLLAEEVFECEAANNCLMPMGITSENVAAEFGVDRATQDALAVSSHKKAAAAMKAGLLQGEITPYQTTVKDKDGNETRVTVDKDDGVRPQTTAEGLGKLKAAFQKGGTTTAGNSSQVTDGASCILLARRDVANSLGCRIIGRIVGFSVAGVPPKVMGIGPAFAIPAALERSGLQMSDIDIFEINEAFASQASYCVKKLGVPAEKLNPKGGAIALGHPLGMTGSRMICTLMSELERTQKRFGIVSMCIGTGMGAAGVFERE
jgi:acetyl-CoA acyltransferase 1|eukprot:CAMPEP_0170464936 /NCGR_PEP_ID=MMETSP0123-20130129/9465_1 /TAXON_ID=182087 /ORGANISM="Favella ehrenbergii, Strain Fehren 1" /LENGTH=416 /DNA_ID=CAMNT_0010730701 /DNA_START=20 /DNA_END=1270 /DNA_ORIENTATION=+